MYDCGNGTHYFHTPTGVLEPGDVCQCWSVRAEFRHADVRAAWCCVVAMDGASDSRFTWIGEPVAPMPAPRLAALDPTEAPR